MLLVARLDHLKQRAERSLAEGDARGALQAYRDAIEAASGTRGAAAAAATATAATAATTTATAAADLARLHSNASAVALRVSRLDEALEHAESALRASPRWPKAHWRRGRALLALGRRPEAAAAFAVAAAGSGGGIGPWLPQSPERQLSRECAAACWDAVGRHTRQEVADELLRLLGGGDGVRGEKQQRQHAASREVQRREAAFLLVKASDARRQRRRRQQQPSAAEPAQSVPLPANAPGYHRLLLQRWLLLEAAGAAGAVPAAPAAAALVELVRAHERALLAARVALATRDYGSARAAASAARSAAEALMRALPAPPAAARAAVSAADAGAAAAADAVAELLGAALAEAALLQGDAWSRFGHEGEGEGEGEGGGGRVILSRPEARAALEAYELASALAVDGEEEEGRGRGAAAGGGAAAAATAAASTTFRRPAARRRVARVERLLSRLGHDDEDDEGDKEEPQETRAMVCLARPGPVAAAAARAPAAPLPPPLLPAAPYQHYRLVDGQGRPVERPDKHPFGLTRVAYGGERGAAGAAITREEDVWAELGGGGGAGAGGDGDGGDGGGDGGGGDDGGDEGAPFLLRGRLRWRQTAAAVVLRLEPPPYVGAADARYAVTIETYRVRVDALPPPSAGGGLPSSCSSSTLALPPPPPLPLLDAALERGAAPAESHWTVERGSGGAVTLEMHLSKLNLELLAHPNRHADTWWPRLFHCGGGDGGGGGGGNNTAAGTTRAIVPSSGKPSSFAARVSVAVDDYMKDYRDLPPLAMREVARDRAREEARRAAEARDAERRARVAAADATRRRRRAAMLLALRSTT